MSSDDEKWVDPVIEAYKPGVDRTLIIENLRRTVEQRIRLLEDHQRTILELHRAGKQRRSR